MTVPGAGYTKLAMVVALIAFVAVPLAGAVSQTLKTYVFFGLAGICGILVLLWLWEIFTHDSGNPDEEG